MFVNVGRFRFRPMGQDEQQRLMQRIEQDVPPIARESPGFRGVYFVRPSDDEVMAVWLWDSQADWEAALARFGPLLQEYVIPNLTQPPERVGGEVVIQVTP
ncbi:MAG: antibiotic biosynthesis monooxygenase [Armatimonadetes bacterium]|nr:antibiotic biosynthesis monooxygenase [Armatimonadota bacterium]